MDHDERIRERAFHIWISEGRPLGHDAEHWERARQQIEREMKEGAQAHKAGVNEVPAANIAVHKGAESSSPTPGFEKPDGLNTPGVAPRRK